MKRLRRQLSLAKKLGLDPEKIYRLALEADRVGAFRLPSPLVPHPLPTYNEVKPGEQAPTPWWGDEHL